MKWIKKLYRKIFPKKPPEAKCCNCRLYNWNTGLCGVVILHEGEKISLPMDPGDDCFFENCFISVKEENGQEETFRPEIQSAAWWVEDQLGRPAKEGIVKMEYPEGFFKDKDHGRI